MNQKHKTPAVLMLVTALAVTSIIGAIPSAAAGHETTATFQAKDVLPKELLRGEYHTVADQVLNDGYMNHYRISSEFGKFEAYGTDLLVVRIHELEALAQLDELSKSEVFLNAAREAGVGQLKAIADFAERPVETIKGIPGGVSRMFKRYKHQAGELYDGAREAVQSDGEDDQDKTSKSEATDKAVDATEAYAKKWFGITAAERRWAKKLEVDPYSSNTTLRKAIAQVARVDAAAKFGMKVALLKVPGVGALQTVNSLVWDTDPRDLRILNEKQLRELGVDDELLGSFFDNPWHSPTRQTIIVKSVVELPGAENRTELIAEGALIQTEEESRFYARNMMILAWYHREKSPLARVLDSTAAPCVLTRQGRMVAVAAADHLLWTDLAAERANTIRSQAGDKEGRAVELWLLGSCSNRCRREMAALGIEIFDNNRDRFAGAGIEAKP